MRINFSFFQSPELIVTKFFEKRWYDVFIWIPYIIFWSILNANGAEGHYINSLINATIIIFFHALVSYFNIFVLFPKFLQKRKFIQYKLSIFMSIILICFPLAIVFYSIDTVGTVSKSEIWSVDFFFYNAVSATYTVFLTLALFLFKKWYQKEIDNKELEQVNTETELKYLKSQINPHFLFNSLNSLYALTLKKSDNAPEVVLKLSDLLRYLLYEAGEKKVPLSKEIGYMKNYVELEQLRQGDRTAVHLSIIGDDSDCNIEPMLFVPFIENAFKHGVDNNIAASVIDIDLNINNGIMVFKISNDKPEHSTLKDADYKGGIGLTNVKKRLDLLYPDHEIDIKDTKTKYTVTLKLNLK